MNNEASKILLLLKIDVENLYHRLNDRFLEYMAIFSTKRTRQHFQEIFKGRYDTFGVPELKLCSEELILSAEQFYRLVDEMKWYLFYTEDMPHTVQEFMHKKIKNLNKAFDTFILYANAEYDSESAKVEAKAKAEVAAEDEVEFKEAI